MGFPAKGLLPHLHPAPSQGRTLTWTRCRPRPYGRQLLGKNDADYDIVSESRGPHSGPCESRCEGLCGVQCAIWSRRKAAQARPLWATAEGKTKREQVWCKGERACPRHSTDSGPLRHRGPFARSEPSHRASQTAWRGGDWICCYLSLRGCFPHTEEVRFLGLSASRGWCQGTTSQREGGKSL